MAESTKKESTPLATVKFEVPYEEVVQVIARGTVKDGVFTISRFECAMPPIPTVDDVIHRLAIEKLGRELTLARLAEGPETRWVFVLRGMPGSGKTSFAKAQPNSVIVSASDYFRFPRGTVPRVEGPLGEHDYDHAESRHSHDYSLREFIRAVHRRDGKNIVVDNTNVNAVSVAPYISIARAYGLSVRIIEFVADVDECHARQERDVAKDVLFRMRNELQMPLPRFWPWPERVYTGRDAVRHERADIVAEKAQEAEQPTPPEESQ